MAITTEYVDRVPGDPGRVKITTEDGQSYYATIDRADNPIVVGTKINADTMSELRDNINALETEVSTLKSNLSARNSTITSLTNRIAALERRQNVSVSVSNNTLRING